MFRGLRLRLTLLYVAAALVLVGLVGGGAYLVVASYLRGVTDLALQHKMTHEFHALAAPIPPELAPADRDWSLVRGEAGVVPLPGAEPEPTEAERPEDDEEGEEGEEGAQRPAVGDVSASADAGTSDDSGASAGAAAAAVSDAELAAIFVLPLDATGRLLFTPDGGAAIAPDVDALRAALASGSDMRTVSAPGGRVRLLTYRLTRDDGPAALQLGRDLSDQDRVLSQLTAGLLALGTLSIALVATASWWIAGLTLRPAQDAWERQQRFIASASHELRTPLTLIRASAEVALRAAPTSDADQRELLGDVLAESDHMRGLVDDLLTLSRLDGRRVALTLTALEIAPLLADLQRQTSRLGAERGVAVAAEGAGTVRADPERLRQVLLILLDNALRHTPQGGRIVLAAAQHGRGVRLSVSDTGGGIPPEHLPHIFERFYRVDPARGRESGNAGLGLSIAKGLVEAMGGQIGAESAVGRGSTFWLTLPAS